MIRLHQLCSTYDDVLTPWFSPNF